MPDYENRSSTNTMSGNFNHLKRTKKRGKNRMKWEKKPPNI